MSTVTARWVLWVSLLLLLPLPFFTEQLTLLPAGYWIRALARGLADTQTIALSMSLALQLLLALVTTAMLAYFYSLWSKHWPSKIRGSIMGLSIFSLLIIFASVPVYDSIEDSNKLTFLQVYQ